MRCVGRKGVACVMIQSRVNVAHTCSRLFGWGDARLARSDTHCGWFVLVFVWSLCFVVVVWFCFRRWGALVNPKNPARQGAADVLKTRREWAPITVLRLKRECARVGTWRRRQKTRGGTRDVAIAIDNGTALASAHGMTHARTTTTTTTTDRPDATDKKMEMFFLASN